MRKPQVRELLLRTQLEKASKPKAFMHGLETITH
jgi:hypothetical protein